MLTEVKSHLKLIWLYMKLNLSSAMEYRQAFLMQVFGMALNNSSFIFFWWLIYQRVGSIGGYEFHDVMFIWALSATAYGVGHIVFGNIVNLNEIILRGELDVYLVQPKDVYINVLASHSSISSWGDLLYGIILFLLSQAFNIWDFMLFIGFSIAGGVLVASFFAMAKSLAFFMGNASSLSNIMISFMMNFSLYPESIYPAFIRTLMYTIIPAGYLIFMPRNILNAFSLSSLGLLILADIAYALMAYWFFRWGLRKYESGNLITTRM